ATMKQISIFLFTAFLSCAAMGKSYIPYFQLCNDADRDMYHKQYDSALVKLEKAFNLVEYVHSDSYKKASECAALTEDFSKAYQYAKKAILNGYTFPFWKGKKLKKMRKTEWYTMLVDSSSHWKNQHFSSINIAYKEVIDSLYYLDQRIVRNNQQVKGDYNIDPQTLPEEIYDLDTSIFQTLLSHIEQYGFPSEQTVGRQASIDVGIIFHHNVRLPENHAYLPMMEEALKKGEFSPHRFAWMYDQGKRMKGESPKFYFGAGTPETLSQQEKDEVDALRKKYGIKPIASTKVKTNGKRVTTLYLW
ncbi:MAG: hypothetical protein AAF206_09555, partial [Bacteroidota bacterium]